MAKTTKKRVKASRRKKTSVSKKVKDTPLAEVESSFEKMALMDFAQNTREELAKLGEKIHEASDRGVHAAREIAKNVRQFAAHATNLTKDKIDLHNLRLERDKHYLAIGEKLLRLHKANKLSSVREKFKRDFLKLVHIESAIAEKEKLAADTLFSTTKKK